MNFTPKTPRFWYETGHKMAKALAPLSKVYAFAHKLNQSLAKPKRAAMKVICVGNITAGGSGKTPAALALMSLIRQHKLALCAHFLTRGYGGKESGPTLIDDKKHSAADTGDESLLLARLAPTIVSKNRYKGSKFAAEKNADVILMDDGLQNLSLMKDLSLVVIDGASGFGNEMMIPAGPLREPLEEGFAKASGFILIGGDKQGIAAKLPADKPLFRAHLKTDAQLEEGNYLAFAGLGRPDKFRETLEQMGAHIKSFRPFADHHPYTVSEMQNLVREAQIYNARLITTEKDFLRIPENFQPFVQTLPVRLEFEEPNEVVALLSGALQK